MTIPRKAAMAEEAKVGIAKWASNHSAPATRILFACGRLWSPAEISAEVTNDTALGVDLYMSLIREGLLEALTGDDARDLS